MHLKNHLSPAPRSPSPQAVVCLSLEDALGSPHLVAQAFVRLASSHQGPAFNHHALLILQAALVSPLQGKRKTRRENKRALG